MGIKLLQLRKKMQEKNIDLYIIPTTDYHGSEYVNDYFKCREYISGFTGSAGTLAVAHDFAGLWTDGRYFIQAEQQLEGSEIELMKIGAPGVPSLKEYVRTLPEGSSVAFDGRVVSYMDAEEFQQDYELVYDEDPLDGIWNERPQLKPSRIYDIDIQVTGESRHSKLRRVRAEMGRADYLIVSRLEDVAWLYNLRGSDIESTPLFYGFALVSHDKDILYVMDEEYISLHGDIEKVRKYDMFSEDLKRLQDCTVMIDEDSASYAVVRSLAPSVKCVFGKSIIERLKAVKNPIEIMSSKQAHIRDGAAMANFLYWLKSSIGKEGITEVSLAERLEVYRREQGAYDVSFATIAGYEAHGAIVHYSATAESDVMLKAQGFILVDSGGQYKDGTTDITRTIALGPVEDIRKKHYTAVLKGHIALASAKFSRGTTGAQLDALARKPISDIGLDFNHGTGHGVGHMLSVHEGPNNISPRSKGSLILPGMITTDEPGIYLEGRYGIRIENELLCIENGGGCAFEAMTLCPYEREAIDISMLEASEIKFIDEYHTKVYETLEPLLKEEVRDWLRQQCRPL